MSAAGVVPVPVLVERAMRRIAAERTAAFNLPHATAAGNARRAARLAEIFARTARWWRLLADSVYRGTADLPAVAGEAANWADEHVASQSRRRPA